MACSLVLLFVIIFCFFTLSGCANKESNGVPEVSMV